MQLHLFGSFDTETSDTQDRHTHNGGATCKILPFELCPQIPLVKIWSTDCSIRFPWNIGFWNDMCLCGSNDHNNLSGFFQTHRTLCWRVHDFMNRLGNRGKIEIFQGFVHMRSKLFLPGGLWNQASCTSIREPLGSPWGLWFRPHGGCFFLLRWKGLLLHQWHKRNLFHRKHPK